MMSFYSYAKILKEVRVEFPHEISTPQLTKNSSRFRKRRREENNKCFDAQSRDYYSRLHPGAAKAYQQHSLRLPPLLFLLLVLGEAQSTRRRRSLRRRRQKMQF
jgi:hypothetical protein